jgi:hypothetical protein
MNIQYTRYAGLCQSMIIALLSVELYAYIHKKMSTNTLPRIGKNFQGQMIFALSPSSITKLGHY